MGVWLCESKLSHLTLAAKFLKIILEHLFFLYIHLRILTKFYHVKTKIRTE